MAKPFYEKPILNSPYYAPTRHHALDDKGQPLEHEPILGRRRSRYLTPVPSARRRRAAEEMELPFHTQEGQPGTYNENAIVNEIRRHVGDWRAVPNPNDWGVTPATQRLLQHWRRDDVQGLRPFFCQVEAVETAIWLAEVARGRRQYAHIFRHLEETNPGLQP